MPMPTIISDKEDVKEALRTLVAELDVACGTVATMLYEGAILPKDCGDPCQAVDAVCEDLEALIDVIERYI